jgi:hypothetical protein
MIVGGELEQRGVEAEGIALTFQHRAAKIVVEDDTCASVPGLERREMATQEAFQGEIRLTAACPAS